MGGCFFFCPVRGIFTQASHGVSDVSARIHRWCLFPVSPAPSIRSTHPLLSIKRGLFPPPLFAPFPLNIQLEFFSPSPSPCF